MPDIKLYGIDRMYENHKEEFMEAALPVMKSGIHWNGEQQDILQNLIADRCGRKYALLLPSGATAMHMAGLAYQQSRMHDSIVLEKIYIHDNTYYATAAGMLYFLNSMMVSNQKPNNLEFEVIPMSEDPSTAQCSSSYIEQNSHQSVFVYANLFGNCADWNAIRSSAIMLNTDVFFIEDAAQSFGAKYFGKPSGSLGDISILSFDPTKNLPNFGSGGALLTDSLSVITDTAKICSRKNHYNITTQHNMNFGMSERDCAEMQVKLRHFDKWQERRTKIAEFYKEKLECISEHISIPKTTEGVEHAWSKFPVSMKPQNSLNPKTTVLLVAEEIMNHGISTKICEYQDRISNTLAYTMSDGYPELKLRKYREKSESMFDGMLYLPIYPELTDLETEFIASKFIDAVKSNY